MNEPNIHDLEARARALVPVLQRQARRPYIVELAGTPKAGKTTTLHVLSRFLKDCGYRVHQMRERASDCPIAMKGHFFFNTWTTTTMLASMIEALESEADVLFMDRGVFDALVWLEVQRRGHQVTEEEYAVFKDFVMLDRWRTLTDLTIVFEVEPTMALTRENKDLLIPRTGSIMSSDKLSQYNKVMASVREDVESSFRFFRIDTTRDEQPTVTSGRIAEKLIGEMEMWADPQIAILPTSSVQSIFKGKKVVPFEQDFWLNKDLTSIKRSAMEGRSDVVGLVSTAMFHCDGKFLLLRRTEERDEKRAVYGPDLLWKGCHVPYQAGRQDVAKSAKAALEARLREDFHLDLSRLGSELVPRYLTWNQDHERDSRHLGVFFNLDISEHELAQSLSKKVFKRERNRTTLGGSEFVSPADLLDMANNSTVQLEPWSREVLDCLVNDGI